jgi:biopolymer transport protein ExbB/TolQ
VILTASAYIYLNTFLTTAVLVTDEKALAEEREKVRQEYENEMKKMREQYLAEQDHKTKLQLDMEKLKQQYEEHLERINKQVQTLF